MNVDYNKFAETFSNSRKNLKWEEIDYFLSFLSSSKTKLNILDVWCWNWRLIKSLENNNILINKYYWVDLSTNLLIEARKNFPNYNFIELNMLAFNESIFVNEKFDYIFLIASFHHLDNYNDRLLLLNTLKKLLKSNWTIFLTNWALSSQLNFDKYSKDLINNSLNDFWSTDYLIKIGLHNRYYHNFSLSELENLFINSWFKIIENREFDNQKNLISILKKI